MKRILILITSGYLFLALAVLVLAVLVMFARCTTAPPRPEIPVVVKGKCDLVTETITLVNQTVTLPRAGRFVLEGHLATQEDTFSGGRLFPKTNTEEIEEHLERSCMFALSQDCTALYRTKWHRQWTPPEGGKAGQGAIGDRKPTVIEEMWSGNMYWVKMPAPGTRFLASHKGKSVVVLMGWEKGPRDPKWLGGLQGEVLWALDATDESQITLGRLEDQSLPPGPISCEGGA